MNVNTVHGQWRREMPYSNHFVCLQVQSILFLYHHHYIIVTLIFIFLLFIWFIYCKKQTVTLLGFANSLTFCVCADTVALMADKWCVYCFIFKQESQDSPFLCPPSGWLLGHAPFPAPPLIKQEYTPNIMIFVIGRGNRSSALDIAPWLLTGSSSSVYVCVFPRKKRKRREKVPSFDRSLLAVFRWKAAPLRHAMRKWSSLPWRVNTVGFFSLSTWNLFDWPFPLNCSVTLVHNKSESNVTCQSSIMNGPS